MSPAAPPPQTAPKPANGRKTMPAPIAPEPSNVYVLIMGRAQTGNQAFS